MVFTPDARRYDKNGAELKIGDRVRVVMYGSPRADISDIDHHAEGMVILSRPIDGAVDWYADSLVKIEK